MKNNAAVSSLLNRLKNAVADSQSGRLLADIKELSEKIIEEKFNLVILGLFKRGKSSLINALLGREILPVGVIPLTAIITLIEFGEREKAEIHFIDGKIDTVPLNRINEFVNEKENPKNVKSVSFLKLFYNNKLLKSVTIIDTPGVGSTLEHNTETTLNFVKKIDAALFTLSVDMPITKSELEFLTHLKSEALRTFFILNKIDLLNEEQLSEVEEYNRKVVGEIWEDKNFEIIRVSSRLAFSDKYSDSGIGNLIERIETLASEEKKNILLGSVLKRMKLIADELISFDTFRLETLKTPANQLIEKLDRFHSLFSIMRNEKEDFDILMEGKTKQLQEHVFTEVNKISKELIKNMEDEFSRSKGKIIEEIRAKDLMKFQEEYIAELTDKFNRLKTELEKFTIEEFERLLIKYGNGANEFVYNLINSLGGMFELDISALGEKFDLNIFTSFYYNFEPAAVLIGLNNNAVKKILPEILIDKLILKKLKNNFISGINSSCGRVIYDVNYKIQESFIKFKFDINKIHKKILKELEEILKDTIARKKAAEEQTDSDVRRLENKLKDLDKLKKDILFLEE